MEPHVPRNIDCAREPRTVIDLPDRRALDPRRVLLRVVQPGFMRPQINQFPIFVRLCAEEYFVKSASSRTSHIEIDYTLCHFEVLQRGKVAFERDTVAAKIVGDLRLA